MKVFFSKHSAHNLRNPEHLQQHRDIAMLMADNQDAVELLPEKLLVKYVAAVKYEEESFNLMRKSKVITDLERLDSERDMVFRGLVHAVKGMNGHFDAAKRDAAQRIANVLAHYGNIPKMGNSAESANIESLHRQLVSDDMTGYTELLGIREWIDKLAELSAQYVVVEMARIEESAEHAKFDMKAARRNTDTMFRMLLNYIEIVLATDLTPELEKFAGELNVILKNYEHSANLEHAHRGESDENGETATEEDLELMIGN